MRKTWQINAMSWPMPAAALAFFETKQSPAAQRPWLPGGKEYLTANPIQNPVFSTSKAPLIETNH